jgi:7-cyano-7-deazaguanine synthase
MEKKCVLFSGGHESTILLHYLLKKFKDCEIYPVYIKFGFDYESVEILKAMEIIASVKNKRIKQVEVVEAKLPLVLRENKIPLRNALLFSLVGTFMYENEIKEVYHGNLGASGYPDNTMDYFDLMEKVISTGMERDFKIIQPFYQKNKKDIYNEFKKEILQTDFFSCIQPVNGKACGRCLKCQEKKSLN